MKKYADLRGCYPPRSTIPSLICILHIIGRFSNECHKTKTKVITLANQKGHFRQGLRSKNPLKLKDFGFVIDAWYHGKVFGSVSFQFSETFNQEEECLM